MLLNINLMKCCELCLRCAFTYTYSNLFFSPFK